MDRDKSLKGIGLFCLNLLRLVSIKKFESVSIVEEHFEKSDIIEYIYNKYQDEFSIPFDNTVYNNEELNKYFYNYSSYIVGNENRKYGIEGNDSGLVLIVALAMDIFERNSYKFFNEE